MKVAFFSSYPPENDGISKYTKRLVDHFPPNVEVSVFTKEGESIQNEERVYRTLSFKLKNIITTYKNIIALRPDIIHVQSTIPLYGSYFVVLWPLIWIVKLKIRSKIIITFHEVKRETDMFQFVGRWYFATLSFFADRIYVHTHEAQVILIQKCHISNKKVLVIPHGTFSFSGSDSKEGYVRDIYKIHKPNIILFFGYIHIHKGIEYLVDAYSILLQTKQLLKKTTQLLIVGSVRPRKGIFRIFGILDFKYFEKIKTQIKTLKIQDNVTLIDYIPDNLIYSFFKIASCVVLPYTNSEQSGILNLAISNQTPIIASDIGGIGETLRDAGILVSPRDSNAISLSIEKIIENPEYAKKLSDSYALLNNKLQPAEVIRIMLDDYKQLI